MKLRRYNFNNSTELSCVSLIAIGMFSVDAQAIAPPAGYDVWSADASGIITATCPANYRCTTEVTESGFLQQRLDELNLNGTIKTGGSVFYRSIISEEGYSNATLVKANSNLFPSPLMRHGIASQQTLGTSQTTLNADTNFSSDTSIYTGWAVDPGVANLQINQSINEVSRKAGEKKNSYLEGHFESLTSINANYDENGIRTGFSFAADQSLDEPGEFRSNKYNEIDSQVFSMRGLEGNMLTTAGSLSLNDSGLSWAEGDRLWGYAIGQNFHHSNGATGSGDELLVGHSTPGSQALGVMFESYDNRSDSLGPVNYFAYFENNVTGWPTVFGAEPVLPAATGNSSSTGEPTGPLPTLVGSLFTPTVVGSEQADGRDAPLAFGQWSVVGGTLTVEGVLDAPIDLVGDGLSPPSNFTQGGDGSIMPECSQDVTCDTDAIVAPGMIQRVITDAEGKRYIQTILTDLGTGFSSESFVSMAETGLTGGSRFGYLYTGGTVEGTKEPGISLKMVLSEDRNDVEAVGHLTTDVAINTGWAARTGTPNVVIAQDISEAGRYFVPFDQQFSYQGNLDAAGNTIGSSVGVDQSSLKSAAIYNGFSVSVNDTLNFAYRSRAGNLQSSIGGVGGIDWDTGDAITATWISNKFSAGQTSGFGGVFYDNLVDDLGYVDVGWQFSGYVGLGSNWISSAFGVSPE